MVLAAGVRPALPRGALAGAFGDHAAHARQPPHDMDGGPAPARARHLGPVRNRCRLSHPSGGSMPITVDSPRGEAGTDSLYNTEEKIFEDIRANPGEKAFVFIHSVPFEGSVSLVNLLTSTRLVRKGFDVSIILYGPGVLLASRHRGYPTIGTEGFPGNLAGNRQIETLIKEGATIYACRFAMGALYGFREEDLIDGVKAFSPLDVLDSALTAWRAGALPLNTRTASRRLLLPRGRARGPPPPAAPPTRRGPG